jgi:DNA-binding IclR family transcriptional regulator
MTVRSVERAVAILEYLARADAPAPLHELSAAIHAPKSTTLTIARTLAARRFLTFDQARKAYELGPRLGEFASRASAAADLRPVARPHLERLARDTGEGAFLSVVEDADVVYVDRVESVQPIRYAASVGSRRPMHATSAGKLALALAPPEFVDRYVGHGLTRHTASTITDAGVLRRQLAKTRRRGWAEARDESMPGLMGFAAPVRDGAGGLVAMVTVAGPTFRMRAAPRTMREAVCAAAHAISLDYRRAAGA